MTAKVYVCISEFVKNPEGFRTGFVQVVENRESHEI